jgi:Cytochrome P450
VCQILWNYSDTVVIEIVDHWVEKSLSTKQPISTSAGTQRYLFLQELASQTTDKKRIRAEAISVLFASRDSTAALLTNVWFELSKRPDIWARLSQEIATLNGSKPTYEELKNLKYLRAVLNESQRLYPIVPANGLIAREDTVLPLGGGEDEKSPILVKKGQFVLLPVYAIHRRKDLYGEDADTFRPERWLDTQDEKGLRMGWAYLPFSGGPRVCPGRKLTLFTDPILPFPPVQPNSCLNCFGVHITQSPWSLLLTSPRPDLPLSLLLPILRPSLNNSLT